MKKYLPFLIIFSLLIVAIGLAQAQGPDIPEINVDIWEILDRALNWFFGIALVIAAIMLVYAGFNYVTAAGNEEKIKTATKTLIFALIGVAIALLAKGLPLLIQEFLQGNNSTSTSQSLNISSNNASYDNLLNIDTSQICLGGYVFDPNAPPEYSCHWDNNACESDSRCGSGDPTILVLKHKKI